MFHKLSFKTLQKNRKLNFVIDFSLIIFVSAFLFNLLFQDTDCNGNFFCYSNPDFLKHSIEYDILFLRAGLNPQNAHWSVELLIPIFFFITMFITGRVKFAGIYTVFWLCFHEILWGITQLYVNYPFSLIWIILLSIIVVSTIMIKPKLFVNWSFVIVYCLSVSFLGTWASIDNLHVTVTIENGIVVLTDYYNSMVTNFFEVGLWVIMFILLVLHIIRHKYVFKVKEDIPR